MPQTYKIEKKSNSTSRPYNVKPIMPKETIKGVKIEIASRNIFVDGYQVQANSILNKFFFWDRLFYIGVPEEVLKPLLKQESKWPLF